MLSRSLAFYIACEQKTLFPLCSLVENACITTEIKQKQTTSNTIMLFFCFSYYYYISSPLSNSVALPGQHAFIIHSFIHSLIISNLICELKSCHNVLHPQYQILRYFNVCQKTENNKTSASCAHKFLHFVINFSFMHSFIHSFIHLKYQMIF